MQKCAVFGHRDFNPTNNEKNAIKSYIENLVAKNQSLMFYCLEPNGFNMFVISFLNELKLKYPKIKIIWILAYLNYKLDDYDKRWIKSHIDETIYPPIEKYLPRYAMIERNNWIIKNCDFALFYVDIK